MLPNNAAAAQWSRQIRSARLAVVCWAADSSLRVLSLSPWGEGGHLEGFALDNIVQRDRHRPHEGSAGVAVDMNQ